MNVRSLILILLCFAGHLCYGLPNNAVERIIGGSDTDIKLAPYMLALKIYNEDLCGATIINTEWAVTSAFCIQRFKDPVKDAILGSGCSTLTNCTVHYITKVVTHEKYNRETSDYDIALMKVEPEFSYDDHTKPVNLASNKQYRDSGTVCGWGLYQKPDYESEDVLSESLRCVELQRMYDDCKKFESGKEISPRMICYGYQEGGKGVCYGDSGGPLISDDNTLLGITLLRYECAEYGPDVFTDAILLQEWIKNNTVINA